jgi:hypothetical protein
MYVLLIVVASGITQIPGYQSLAECEKAAETLDWVRVGDHKRIYTTECVPGPHNPSLKSK